MKNFNYKKEQSDNILSAASVLAEKILSSNKEVITKINFQNEIDDIIKQLNKKVFFKLEDEMIWDLALKNILQKQAVGEHGLYETRKIASINKIFIDNLREEAVLEAESSGTDFYVVLSEKLAQAKRDHLDLDNEYIESHKDSWATEYYNNL